MKLTNLILAVGMTAGIAWGQNPNVIQNTKSAVKAVPVKPAVKAVPAKPAAVKAVPVKPATAHPAAGQPAAHVTSTKKVAAKPVAKKPSPKPAAAVSVESKPKPTEAKNEKPKTLNLTGRRDPFVSPVINQSAVGSGCSTGKRCLAVGAINLKGIVKSESGMIAVVVNALDKAYFLRENDPVFNGYVVRITGDSVVFKETIQDKLGKPFTREVTKRITTPSV